MLYISVTKAAAISSAMLTRKTSMRKTAGSAAAGGARESVAAAGGGIQVHDFATHSNADERQQTRSASKFIWIYVCMFPFLHSLGFPPFYVHFLHMEM